MTCCRCSFSLFLGNNICNARGLMFCLSLFLQSSFGTPHEDWRKRLSYTACDRMQKYNTNVLSPDIHLGVSKHNSLRIVSKHNSLRINYVLLWNRLRPNLRISDCSVAIRRNFRTRGTRVFRPKDWHISIWVEDGAESNPVFLHNYHSSAHIYRAVFYSK
jgi:hypothetical protein